MDWYLWVRAVAASLVILAMAAWRRVIERKNTNIEEGSQMVFRI